MNLDQLFSLFEQARKLCLHEDFVVVGSLSILGLSSTSPMPATMTMSVDVDCYTQRDPGRIFDLVGQLGENTAYHQQTGFFLDPVSPNLPTLPGGWQDRLMKVERNRLRLWFLDPNDAAVSKYARGEPRDGRWIRGGVEAGVVSLAVVRFRFQDTLFLDGQEQRRALDFLEADEIWWAALPAKVVGKRR